MTDPIISPSPIIRLTKLDFGLSIAGLIAWGLSLIGVVTNLVLGAIVLLAALGLLTYEFLKWARSKAWSMVLQVGVVVVVGAVLLWSGGRQVLDQYHQEHNTSSLSTVASSPTPLSVATQSPSAALYPSPMKQLDSDYIGHKDKSTEQTTQKRSAEKQQNPAETGTGSEQESSSENSRQKNAVDTSGKRPEWPQIEKWVRSKYPDGTRLIVQPADDSECGPGCQRCKVILRATGDQSKNESWTVTYQFTNRKWNWNAIKN